ncbi:MAG: DUF6056 family protein [Chloroflexota bacterium]
MVADSYMVCVSDLSFLGVKRPALISLALSALILYAAMIGKVNVLQSFLWTPGLIGYAIGLLWLSLFLGILAGVLRGRASNRMVILAVMICFGGTFLAGGTSEVYDAFQMVIMGLIAIGFMRVASPHSVVKRRALTLLGAAILGAILVFVIMLLAPGNAIRQASLGTPLPLHLVALRTLLSLSVFIASTIAVNNPIPVLIALIVPGIIFWRLAAFDKKLQLTSRQARQLLGVSAGIMFALIAICIFLPIYSTSAAPDTRLLFIPRFVLICTTVFWGSVMGLSVRDNQAENQLTGFRILVFVVVLMVIGPDLSIWTTLVGDAPDYRVFANEWDNREHEIRAAAAAGTQDIQVAAFTVDLGNIAGLDTISSDPTQWVNVCAANYYGVKTITASTN